MKFIEAFWEKRNLGLNTLEIEFDDNEEINYLSFKDKIKNYDYIVAKVPNNNIKICHLLEQNDFKFMESQMFIKKNLKDYSKKNDYFNKFLEKISIQQIIDKSSLEKLLSLIDEDMFNTDRISLDEYFGKKKAMNRYKNWIKDELEKDKSEVYELISQDEKIGFFLIKNIQKNSIDGLLGGIFTKYKNQGMGLSIIQKPMEIAISKNKKYLKTRISSNNISVIKLYNLYGFKIYDIKYVFRKINKEVINI